MQMIPFQCMRCWRRLLMGATPRRRWQLAWRHPWYEGLPAVNAISGRFLKARLYLRRLGSPPDPKGMPGKVFPVGPRTHADDITAISADGRAKGTQPKVSPATLTRTC